MERDALITQIDLLFRNVNRQFKCRMEELMDGHVTYAEFIFLRYLHDAGSCRPSDVSRALGVTLSHITNMCDRMLDKKLVYRKRSQEDRRTIEIGLTEEGDTLFGKLHDLRQQYITNMYNEMNTKELQQLVYLFEKMDDYLRNK